MTPPPSSAEPRKQPISEATKVTLVGMWADIVLGLAKIIGGILGNSFALVTDGIHSLTDAVSDIFVLVMARIGQAEPDTEHPWGHGRFETVGTIAMGMLFFSTAGILVYDSLTTLWSSEISVAVPTAATMAIALVSIATKEWLYHYTMRVAVKLNSSLLKANAWHSRSDSLSSIAVAIGIGGALLGYPWMDVLAAIFVALIIAKIGWELCLDALRELVDTQIPLERREQIKNTITEVEGVKGLSNFRSRLSGGKTILEISIAVLPNISVSDGHAIGSRVASTVRAKFSDVSDVIFHIDALDELTHAKEETELSELDKAKQLLLERWVTLLSKNELDKIQVLPVGRGIDVMITLDRAKCEKSTVKELSDAIANLDCVANLTIYTKAHQKKFVH